MISSQVNYYWQSILPSVLQFARNDINVPNSWLYAGSTPCTWSGYDNNNDNILDGDMWFNGDLKFSIFTQGGAMSSPGLIFQ